MAEVTDEVPQWKKDLILRKRTQSKWNSEQLCPPTTNSSNRAQQSGSVGSARSVTPGPRDGLSRSGRTCDKSKMVQDTVVLPTRGVANGKESDSDSSEELQYGPGIVSKLKSKYLSLTLREKAVKPRGSILRRAASLENMLEAEEGKKEEEKKQPERRFVQNNVQNGHKPATRYRSTTRSPPETIKRARSVESIHHRHDSGNEDVVIVDKDGCGERKSADKAEKVCNGTHLPVNRPKRIMPFIDESEKPPADHVRHTALLFEAPAKRTKVPKPTGQVAAKVAAIIEKNVKKKPQITSPKPSVNGKRKVVARSASPKECRVAPVPHVAPTPPDVAPTLDASRDRIPETPDLILHSSPLQPSPTAVKKFTESFLKTEQNNVEIRSETPEKPSPPLEKPLSPPDKPPTPTPTPTSPDCFDGVTVKPINMQAIQNISQASHTVTFKIPDNICRSHLPKLSTIPVGINRLIPDTSVMKPPPKPKVEAVNELISPPKSLVVVKERPGIITTFRPTVPAPPPPKKDPPRPKTKPLTSREIAKNLINNAKTLQEQPISKVVVSVRSVEEVVSNCAGVGKKGQRGQEQTSLLFNFQDRDTVPDYISHDSAVPARRGKREKPKVSENVT